MLVHLKTHRDPYLSLRLLVLRPTTLIAFLLCVNEKGLYLIVSTQDK